MNRLNVYAEPDQWGQSSGKLTGWFDTDKADYWSDRDYNNNGSLGTGRGTGLYRTAQGRWVSDTWSIWQDEPRHAGTFTTPEDAREWLLRNDEDEAVTKYFGEIEEERGPGRPAIGEQVCFTVPVDELATIDAYAKHIEQSRSHVLRLAVSYFVTSVLKPPWTSSSPLSPTQTPQEN